MTTSRPNQIPISEILQYPLDILAERYGGHKMVIRRLSRRLDNQVIATIVLPIPQNLTTAYNLSWAETELNVNPENSALMTNFEGNFQSENFLNHGEAMYEGVKGGIKTVLQNLKGAAGLVVSGGLSGRDLFEYAKKEVFNPHVHVLFKSVGLRDHQFSFNFRAKNKDESQEIKRIIDVIKLGALPYVDEDRSVTTGYQGKKEILVEMYRYPDEFEIDFMSGGGEKNRFLHQIGRSVITFISINYNGQGIPVFFEDTNAPVDISVSIGFKELEAMTRDKARRTEGAVDLEDQEFRDQTVGNIYT